LEPIGKFDLNGSSLATDQHQKFDRWRQGVGWLEKIIAIKTIKYPRYNYAGAVLLWGYL
jgi:hypothetical protein